jgi:glutathione S-transferase
VNLLPQLAQLLILIPSPYSDTSTNEQKRDWFLRLNPNGKSRPSLPSVADTNFDQAGSQSFVDNTQSPPFPVMETSAEHLYLLKFDKDHCFGFKDELEQSELLQWLFFWRGSSAPSQGNLGYFRRAQE